MSDFGNDRIAFRHDVLREWAIANLLSADWDKFAWLTLAHPAPAVLARGVELATRMALERSADATTWATLLDLLSGGQHPRLVGAGSPADARALGDRYPLTYGEPRRYF